MQRATFVPKDARFALIYSKKYNMTFTLQTRYYADRFTKTALKKLFSIIFAKGISLKLIRSIPIWKSNIVHIHNPRGTFDCVAQHPTRNPFHDSKLFIDVISLFVIVLTK